MISAIEFRSEDDPELAAHTHAKRIEMRTVSPSREVRLTLCYVLVFQRSKVGHEPCSAVQVMGRACHRDAAQLSLLLSHSDV